MKKLFYILVIMFLLFSCNKSPITCSYSGYQITKEFDLESFYTVEVNQSIYLTIIDTSFNKLIIKADNDIFKNISFDVVNDKLILANNTNCTVENTDANADMTLYVDNITRLVANTDLRVDSGNIWHFNTLDIVCEDVLIGSNNLADFYLQVDIDKLNISANGNSIFNIEGYCDKLFVGFYSGNPVFRGANLKAQEIKVFQRSNADMHLYPLQSIYGDLYGYGNIYLYNSPSEINIIEHYAGHIYFVN